MTRREMINVLFASRLSAWLPQGGRFSLQSLKNTPAKAVTAEASNGSDVRVIREWSGSVCRSRLVSAGLQTVRVKEVVLFEIPIPLPAATRLYGEGFQMLSQTGGTLGRPSDLGNYTDAQHYKMPAPANAKTFYGMMTLTSPEKETFLLAFTSCRRFVGQFYLGQSVLQAVVDTEGIELRPGQSYELEEFTFQAGSNRSQLLGALAKRLNTNHPANLPPTPPTGWCSWYCFGPNVTAQQVLDNLDFIAKNVPALKYIQIDDGYQAAMGDWLETGSAFGGDIRSVLNQIRNRGFEPAIWVAPFIAEEKSHVFEQHPDWFVRDAHGKPLRSDLVTFGGWRRGPWYVLDGTHSEVQSHLEGVFRTMRRDWGCTYFKLDANFWGAMHGGRFRDATAMRIEAYRRGMQAIRRGAGDSFILGCNHPIWPSLGLIHGSRSSNDIRRTWDRMVTTARQNLNRNWQNGRLWWNDSDAVVLTGDLPDNEFQFHATAIYASGGMVLSGDDLTKTPPARLEMLKKLLPPTGVPAQFEDDSLRVGIVKKPNSRMICVFNWDDKPQTISFRLERSSSMMNYWSGERLGRHQGVYRIHDMPPRSAQLLICE